MTNSNLITIFNGQIANQSIQLCNARSLYDFLEITARFNDWIKNRIDDYGFIQNEDYIIVTERTAGRPRKEYHITLDMGKELEWLNVTKRDVPFANISLNVKSKPSNKPRLRKRLILKP